MVYMQTGIYNVDYNEYVNLLGTAHFTKRSLQDAYRAVEQFRPDDLAVELDLRRFRSLNMACWECMRSNGCTTKCEFIGAIDALGNVNVNIWLIDMSEREIGLRIRQLMTPAWIFRVNLPFLPQEDEMSRLWEQGFKDEVVNSYQRRLESLRRKAPTVWRVLIDERNTIMAARLAWIASEKLRESEKPNILALVGAAHVEGIKKLLSAPLEIKENLPRLGLAFTPPTYIRRIRIETN